MAQGDGEFGSSSDEQTQSEFSEKTNDFDAVACSGTEILTS